MEEARKEIGDLAASEEDVLSYTLFPDVAKDYFERRGSGTGYRHGLAGNAS